MANIKYLTREKYELLTQKYEGGHWTKETIETRWDYHHRVIELLKGLKITSVSEVLELGTMGVSCIDGSDSMDYADRWNFPGKNPTYLHDARIFPWPIKDKQYEVFVALRVFQHLTPVQKESFIEAIRIAKKIILVIPDIYHNTVLPDASGITYQNFYEFLNGVHPNLYLPTAQGWLYFWDTENPSSINLEKVMERISIAAIEQY